MHHPLSQRQLNPWCRLLFSGLLWFSLATSARAQSLSPADELYTRAVAAYKTDRDPVKAIAAFGEVLQLDPNHIQSRFQLGSFAKAKEQWLDAAKWFDEIARIAPGSVMGRKAATEARALRLTEAYTRSEEGKSILLYRELLADAHKALKEKNYGVAGEKCERAMNLIPQAWEAYVLCSSSLIGLQKFKEAEQILRLAITTVPDDKKQTIEDALTRCAREQNYSELYARGTTAQVAKKFTEAVGFYTKAWDAVPERRAAGVQVLQCHVMAKDFKAAVQIIPRIKSSGAGTPGATSDAELDKLAAEMTRLGKFGGARNVASTGKAGPKKTSSTPAASKPPKNAVDELSSKLKLLK